MAGASLLTLLDDIATILDDVAVMSKVAAKKTAGVLGDDLALNAQQVTGVSTDRELPVVWAVAKGSFKNKLILVPSALLISAFIPWLITPLLMFGGLYLCFEGYEKIHEKLFHNDEPNSDDESDLKSKQANLSDEELIEYEKTKVTGAIRTDFVLSAEIIAITLGVVAHEDIITQASTLAIIAIIMTIGVYGLVAAIVRMDDAGAYLLRKNAQQKIGVLGKYLGVLLLNSAPKLMKFLTFAGTVAMFMVGGGIIDHGVHILNEPIRYVNTLWQSIPAISGFMSAITPSLLHTVLGVIVGSIALASISVIKKLFSSKT
ncbi:DUF808 domain-containing protein [Shewanella sp. OPT22]|nr:DUF808 domain-containing protein [Shewanella sp. OPT22]